MTEHACTCTLSPAELTEAASLYAQAAASYQGSVKYDGSRALVTLRGDRERIAALLET